MKEVVTILEAINHALDHSLKVNKDVVLLGQDIGPNGGVFRVTDGLQQKYGEERVIDTPLAENMIAGITVGMAVSGLVPIAEFQFMGFIYPAVDTIRMNHYKFHHIIHSMARLLRWKLAYHFHLPIHHYLNQKTVHS